MLTLNGTGTTIYGNAKPMPLLGENAALADELALHPCSYQVVKWFTILFLPVVPLGTYRVVKVRQSFLTIVAPQFLMERMPCDRRQIIIHYLVGWSPALVFIILLGSLAFLQSFNLRLANQLELPILLLIALSILVAGGLLLASLFRETSTNAVSIPLAKNRDSPVTNGQVTCQSAAGATQFPENSDPASHGAEVVQEAILIEPDEPTADPTAPVPIIKIIGIALAAFTLIAILACAGFALLLYQIGRTAGEVEPPPILPQVPLPQPAIPPLDVNPDSLPILSPVPSSNKAVISDTALRAGDPVQAEWAGQWYRAEILQVRPDGQLKIRWTDWGPEWDETVNRSRLQLHNAEEPIEKAD